MAGLTARLVEAVPVAAIGLLAFTAPRTAGIQQAVGPWVFPWAAGFGMLLCSAFLVFRDGPSSAEPVTETRKEAALWLAATAISYTILITRVGFIPSASLAFFFVTRAFGTTSPVRDAVIGVLFAFVCHGLFTTLLGVRLGPAFLLWN